MTLETVAIGTPVFMALGAVMIGWVITLLGMINGPFAIGNRWVFISLALSAGTPATMWTFSFYVIGRAGIAMCMPSLRKLDRQKLGSAIT
jgi:hypothetical protein